MSKYIKRKYPVNLVISNGSDYKDERNAAGEGNTKQEHESKTEKDLIREEKISSKWVLMIEIKENIIAGQKFVN